MGDYSNCYLNASVTDPVVQAKVLELFEQYSGGRDHFEEEIGPDGVSIGANEIRVGTVDDLRRDLLALIKDGFDSEDDGHVDVPDFAFSVNDEPAYEWLGTIVIHVPGIDSDFYGSCDSDGNTTLSGAEVLTLVNEAETLEGLRGKIAELTGHTHQAAWAALGN